MAFDIKSIIIFYKNFKAWDANDLVPSHGEILFRLFNDGPQTMSSMAKTIKRDPSTITTLVNKLIKYDFIKLVENQCDMRSKLIVLTNKGEAFEKEFTKISEDLNSCLLKWNLRI